MREIGEKRSKPRIILRVGAGAVPDTAFGVNSGARKRLFLEGVTLWGERQLCVTGINIVTQSIAGGSRPLRATDAHYYLPTSPVGNNRPHAFKLTIMPVHYSLRPEQRCFRH